MACLDSDSVSGLGFRVRSRPTQRSDSELCQLAARDSGNDRDAKTVQHDHAIPELQVTVIDRADENLPASIRIRRYLSRADAGGGGGAAAVAGCIRIHDQKIHLGRDVSG